MTSERRIVRLRVVQRRTGQRVVVELDHGESIELDPEIVVARGLKAGASMSAEALEQLRREDEWQHARQRLMRYLALRVRSVADARGYLERAGFGEEAVRKALDHAVERDVLDDRRFAERFVRTRLKTAPVGPLRLLADLLSHGIEEGLAREALRPQFDREWQRDTARQLAEKRFGPAVPAAADARARKKIIAWLQQRGFEAEIAYAVAGGSADNEDFSR